MALGYCHEERGLKGVLEFRAPVGTIKWTRQKGQQRIYGADTLHLVRFIVINNSRDVSLPLHTRAEEVEYRVRCGAGSDNGAIHMWASPQCKQDVTMLHPFDDKGGKLYLANIGHVLNRTLMKSCDPSM